MIHPVDTMLALALLSILFSFGSSRLPSLIKVVGFQGIVVCIVPLFLGHGLSPESVVFSIAALCIRGILIPVCIYVAIRKAAITREVKPIVGFHASIFFGLILMVGATMASHRFDVAADHISRLFLPTAISLLGAGMFLLMARRNAIAMVLGYMVLENGIYLVGCAFSQRVSHITEFGILLDILAGVMIMAVILRNMKTTFNDLDTDRLRTLKE
ncbi:NADH-quinone oxidoreductase subunit K [Desulfosarcina sp. OttesenSCG-928-A07]|nr:NADH-quinone oxidoreductase subunit K [Desulfosarcina sp. OttesenSCG-928-A07]